MPDHVHIWTPILGMAGRYECECSSTGYRAFSGAIAEHKTPHRTSPEITARPYTVGHGGRIPPKPTSRG